VCWLTVTFLTPPETEAHLVAFYQRTRPDGPGWKRIAALAGGPPPGRVGALLVDWLAGVVLVYAVLFGIGTALLGKLLFALLYFAIAAIAAGVISRDLSRRGWKSIIE
jgi:hypothetical protein